MKLEAVSSLNGAGENIVLIACFEIVTICAYINCVHIKPLLHIYIYI